MSNSNLHKVAGKVRSDPIKLAVRELTVPSANSWFPTIGAFGFLPHNLMDTSSNIGWWNAIPFLDLCLITWKQHPHLIQTSGRLLTLI